MKRCYKVEMTVEALVVAESEEEAMDIGEDALKEEMSLLGGIDVFANQATYYPSGWSASCLVYGTDEDMTAKDALALNED